VRSADESDAELTPLLARWEVGTNSQDVVSQGFPLLLPQDLMGMEDGELAMPGARTLSSPFRTRGALYKEMPFYGCGAEQLRDNPYYRGRSDGWVTTREAAP
jgi:hypothetical protein